MLRTKRVKTPTIIQMEAVECGAAALGMVLGYYKKFVPLEELRTSCGVSRDGSKASNMVRAARLYGMTAKGFKKSPEALKSMRMPVIAFVNFNHFVVVEGFAGDKVYFNDPAMGRRTVSWEEYDQAFTGVVLAIEPGPEFRKSGKPKSLVSALAKRASHSKAGLAYAVLMGLALVIPGLVIPTFSKVFVDSVLLQSMGGWLRPLLLGMGLTALLRGVLTWFQQSSLLRLETRLSVASSSQFFWHVLRLPMEFFTQRFSGEIGTRVGINDRVAQLLSGELATHFLNLMTVIFFAAIMFQYSALLTGIGIAMAGLNVLALQLIARTRVDANQKLLQVRGKQEGVSMSGLMSMETIKANGGESDFFATWAGYQARLMNEEQKLGLATQILNVVPVVLTALNTALVLGVGSLQVMEGRMTIGSLVAFQSLMASFIGPVNKLVGLGTTLQEVKGEMNRLDDVLHHDQDPLFADQDVPDEARAGELAKLPGHLELQDITFGYSPLDKPLIEHFNLSLAPGKRIALVGSSGSGKSTISKLVCGLYQPWSGEILFDGQKRAELGLGVLTGSLACVDQEIFLFEGTVRDNLTTWDATVPESQVIAAAKDASIHTEIAARTGGYASMVEEGGRNFSGGQRQRLEIARALVSNPSILVLDEATSALDPTTELIIDDSIRQRGCTCLIVAHRLSTIRDCDEIIVLQRGQVVQRGSHDEMKDADGPYKDLIRSETQIRQAK
ncbi:MAG: NHLP family bacteriocin export ABC transporter peptidase/permease/ATPase subunit [Pseudomonadota bacterium]